MKNTIQENDKRYTEVRFDDIWIRTKFNELMECDEFKLYEPDGAPVNGGQIYIAESYAYQNQDGVWTVECQIVK